jgi:hypothetical protein
LPPHPTYAIFVTVQGNTKYVPLLQVVVSAVSQHQFLYRVLPGNEHGVKNAGRVLEVLVLHNSRTSTTDNDAREATIKVPLSVNNTVDHGPHLQYYGKLGTWCWEGIRGTENGVCRLGNLL